MRKISLLLFCLIFPSLSFALNPPVKSTEDIIGCYERIDFSEEAKKKINVIEPWPIRYQWFCFEPDGTLYSHSSTKYTKHTQKSLREIYKLIPKDITYTIPHKGIIETLQVSAHQKIPWGGNFMDKGVLFDEKVIHKGTLIMSIFSPKVKKNIYHRYLKKLK